VEVERLAEENILCNNVLYHTNQPTLRREQAGLMTANYFIPRGAARITLATTTSVQPPRPAGTSTPSTIPIPTTTPPSSEQGSVICAALDDLMHQMTENKSELDFARQSKYPTELMLSIQFVFSQLGHEKPTNTSKPSQPTLITTVDARNIANSFRTQTHASSPSYMRRLPHSMMPTTNQALITTTLQETPLIIIEIKLLYCISTSVLKLQLMPLKTHPCVTPNHGKYSCPGS
jgi:hypothetical protein